MGGNRTGVRKDILFYVTLLICLSISSCALLESQRVEKVEKAVPEQGARDILNGGKRLSPSATIRLPSRNSRLLCLSRATSPRGTRPFEYWHGLRRSFEPEAGLP